MFLNECLERVFECGSEARFERIWVCPCACGIVEDVAYTWLLVFLSLGQFRIVCEGSSEYLTRVGDLFRAILGSEVPGLGLMLDF